MQEQQNPATGQAKLKGFLPGVSKPVLTICVSFVGIFCLYALINIENLSSIVSVAFAFSAKYFGLYWQLLFLATFLIGLLLCVLPGGKAIMGGLDKPEFSVFQWASMIMCTLLAGGGVFWAAGEPLAHFISTPPYYGEVEAGSLEAANVALAQSFLHWGFLAWAILGSLTTVMLMYYHYEKGLPLAPRTLLYPVFGEKALHGAIGWTVDATCIIAVLAGTIGPIGFLGLQVSYGMNALFGIPDVFATQVAIIIGLACIYTASALSGVTKGIQLLSKINMIVGAILLLFLAIAGPTVFIFTSFFQGFATHLVNFFPMALYRGDAGFFGDAGWLGWWTVFFWGWFMGYGPLMAIFIARVSKGRSIRAIIILLSIIAPIITMFWFTIVGGSGLGLEIADPGLISKPFEGFNLPAALLAITQALPLGFIVSLLFLVLTTIFVATTGDSMTYVMSVTMSDSEHPAPSIRVFWGVSMAIMAIILIADGSKGIGNLQSFIVVTAVPVSVILLPSLWDALRITLLKGKELKEKELKGKEA